MRSTPRAGDLSFRQRRLEDAVRYYEKAAALMETDFGAPGMLISCYTALGDVESARRVAADGPGAGREGPGPGSQQRLAMGFGVAALAALGEAERARDWMDRALLIDPDNLTMRYNFACALAAHLSDAEAALEMLGPVLERGRRRDW